MANSSIWAVKVFSKLTHYCLRSLLLAHLLQWFKAVTEGVRIPNQSQGRERERDRLFHSSDKKVTASFVIEMQLLINPSCWLPFKTQREISLIWVGGSFESLRCSLTLVILFSSFAFDWIYSEASLLIFIRLIGNFSNREALSTVPRCTHPVVSKIPYNSRV